MATGEVKDRIDTFRAKNAARHAEIERALAEEQERMKKQERAIRAIERRQKIANAAQQWAGAAMRTVAAVMVYNELSSVAWGLVFWVTLETIAGRSRQQ